MEINARQIPPSLTIAFHGMAYELRQQGHRLYDLTAGEPKVPIHPLLLQKLQQRMSQEHAYYAPVAGLTELRQAATAWMNRRYACALQPENCLVTGGGKFGLYLLFTSLLKPGDEVLIPSPYWVTFPTLAEFWGGSPVPVETFEADDFRVTVDALERATTSNTRILVLNNAGNPTGTLYSREDLEAILAFAASRDLIVFSDEVYSELVYEGSFVSCASFPAYQDRVFVVQSCSKSFAMTGWRVGFVFGRDDVLKALSSLQSQSLTSASTVSQWAATLAFQHADTIINWVREQMRERRDLFVATYQDVFEQPLPPPASALYAFLNLEKLGFSHVAAADSLHLCTDILKTSHVATVPGVAFGMEGYVRCSFAGAAEDIVEGLQRIRGVIDAQG